MTAPLLVLGASGLLGAAIADKARRSTPVVGVSRRQGPWIHADVADAGAVASLLEDVAPRAVVFAVGRARGSREELDHANVKLLDIALSEASSRGVRLVALGSAAEYGDPASSRPVREDDDCAPVSPYGRSKLDATRRVLARHDAGEPVTVARLFNVVSPNIPKHQPVGELLDAVRSLPASGGVVSVGNADVVRDFVTLDFAAEAVLSLALGPAADPVVNVCSGEGVRLGDFVSALARHRGVTAEIESRGEPALMAVVGDPRRLHAATGLDRRSDLSQLAAAAWGQTA